VEECTLTFIVMAALVAAIQAFPGSPGNTVLPKNKMIRLRAATPIKAASSLDAQA
jgi:hypothetical protein